MSIKAVLLMAGEGVRFGAHIPKQFHLLAGKRVYLHTLERFLETQLFLEIVLVCHPLWVKTVEEETRHYDKVRVVAGGGSRQESSRLGLLACTEQTEYVVIHDAVRPFVSKDIIERNVQAVCIHNAVDTCIPSTDTIIKTEDGMHIDAIPPRAHYWRGQTPQSFSYARIMKAHETTSMTNASDDCSLMLGEKIHIVLGNEVNMKITTELDFLIAEKIINSIN